MGKGERKFPHTLREKEAAEHCVDKQSREGILSCSGGKTKVGERVAPPKIEGEDAA